MLDDKNKKPLSELEELGEFGLIRHLTENIKLKNPSSLKGVGDDAAVIRYEDKQTVVSTDLLVEGIHFDLLYTPLKHLGYKSVTVNLSDVYAMNAMPKQITVSLAVSNRMSVEGLEELYDRGDSCSATNRSKLSGLVPTKTPPRGAVTPG